MPQASIVASFILFRHGESEWNAQGRWQGQGDPSLTQTGRRQVQQTARSFVENPDTPTFQKIISSDLKRAAQSAKILGEALGLPIKVDARFRELDVGEWSGLSHEEISQRWPEDYNAFRAGDAEVCLGGAESWSMLRARFRQALGELALEFSGKTILLVAHGGAIRSVLPGLHLDNAGWHGLDLPHALASAWAAGDVAQDVEADGGLVAGAGGAQAAKNREAL
ncbi:MAG: histidine phosphatase family protein [Deltaproteobacteria bacterium]|nr:histidine phosphatase family protein [Deltaproteobacteria bacterium]